MKKELINEQINIQFPDEFSEMDKTELSEYFNSIDRRWGIHDTDMHIVVSVGWVKVNALVSLITDAKSVANGAGASLERHLKDFIRGEDISVQYGGQNFVGFGFEFRASDDESVVQCGRLAVTKVKKLYYAIYFIVRKDTAEESFGICNDIMASISFEK